jgi:hypothetical protein
MEGWWEGTLRGKTGMFPDNFVKVVEKSSSSGAPPVEVPTAMKVESSGDTAVPLRNNSSRNLR